MPLATDVPLSGPFPSLALGIPEEEIRRKNVCSRDRDFRTSRRDRIPRALEKARNIDDVLRAMPGFVGREILQTDDGKWIDLVRWRSLPQAREAAEKVMTIPECLAFFDLIDKER